MRFLKLLDPRERMDAGEQQRRAGELFPELVRDSRLHYWRPGNPVYSDGLRLLMGLAPSFSLPDLRLADVINESLAKTSDGTRVDVFNMATDLNAPVGLADYYPLLREHSHLVPPVGSVGWRLPQPVLGVWRSGVCEELLDGWKALKRTLELVQSPLTPEQFHSQLPPTSWEFFDDESA